MKEWIKSQDQFGRQVELKFKGNSSIQSFPGGILSLLAKLIVIAYLGTKIQLLANKSTNKEILTLKKDVVLNPGYHRLSRDKFDYALLLVNNWKEDIDISRYLTVIGGKREGNYREGFFYVETKESEAEICGEDGFDISEEQNRFLRVDKFYCPEKENELSV